LVKEYLPASIALHALPAQAAAVMAHCRSNMDFSIIIPTLNEEDNISRCLKSIIKAHDSYAGNLFEIIIVDGESTDKTVKTAEELIFSGGLSKDFTSNFKIIKPGFTNLPLQLNEGARNSKGEILIFLHADNALPDKAFEKISHLFSGNLIKKRRQGMRQKGRQYKGHYGYKFKGRYTDKYMGQYKSQYIGGAFTLLIEGKRFFYTISSFFGNLYSCATKIYFGDRMIFIKRAAFLKLGGFKNMPIMSDVDFSMRMNNLGKTALLAGPTLTSPRGIANDPFWKRIYLILWALHFYKKGLDPDIIKEKYYGEYSRKQQK
jgi:glycosyltransferase involved in cell wall biosynthesis